ncbi:hypothetical protein CPB86DRAFT_499969 [Serendipita vermifera]|nr:hypothetical protein CPB86DRAFT_499969 [Serendipita vermifera]
MSLWAPLGHSSGLIYTHYLRPSITFRSPTRLLPSRPSLCCILWISLIYPFWIRFGLASLIQFFGLFFFCCYYFTPTY